MNVQLKTSPTVNITDLSTVVAAKLQAVLHGVDDPDMIRLEKSIRQHLEGEDAYVYDLTTGKISRQV